jgi:thioredoxin 1
MSIVDVDEGNFQSVVLDSRQPVLVAFLASWSRPCQILGAVLDELASTCAESASIVKVDADNNPDLSMSYDVECIPTLLYFVSGTLRARVVGTATKEAILSRLQNIKAGNQSAYQQPIS